MSYMKPIRMDGGPDGIRCMSLACQSKGSCAPIGMTNSMPPMPIYPPDCSTGATDPRALGHDAPPVSFGNDMAAAPSPLAGPSGPQSGQSSAPSFDLASIFGGMSTTTLLVIGAAAYFLFFKKGR